MESKTFEIRDRGTFIPMLAVKLKSNGNADEKYLLRRAGLDRPGSYQIHLVNLNRGEGHFDSYRWTRGARTVQFAHEYIEKNFDILENGAVIDVEFLLGETTTPKQSEKFFDTIEALQALAND